MKCKLFGLLWKILVLYKRRYRNGVRAREQALN